MTNSLWFGDHALGLLQDAEYTKLLFFLSHSTASHFISLCMSEIVKFLGIFDLILFSKLVNDNTGKGGKSCIPWLKLLLNSQRALQG